MIVCFWIVTIFFSKSIYANELFDCVQKIFIKDKKEPKEIAFLEKYKKYQEELDTFISAIKNPSPLQPTKLQTVESVTIEYQNYKKLQNESKKLLQECNNLSSDKNLGAKNSSSNCSKNDLISTEIFPLQEVVDNFTNDPNKKNAIQASVVNLKILPSILDQLKQTKEKELALGFYESCCYERANFINTYLKEMGITTSFIYKVGSIKPPLEIETKNPFLCWSFHVALLVLVQSDDLNSPKNYIIDFALHPSGLTPLEDWSAIVKPYFSGCTTRNYLSQKQSNERGLIYNFESNLIDTDDLNCLRLMAGEVKLFCNFYYGQKRIYFE